ncbi:hypothetical protein FISHEDRAFT_27304, partial [Fistulina hepatica ATCC 64428]
PPGTKFKEDLKPSATREYQIAATSSNSRKEYYTFLRDAIVAAKTQIGDELTEWRDAVGKAELSKEASKPAKSEFDESENDEDDQE